MICSQQKTTNNQKVLCNTIFTCLTMLMISCGPHETNHNEPMPQSTSGESFKLASSLIANDHYLFLLGSGRADITGPASNLATAGYGAPAPKTAGIHQRLWARSFVIADHHDSDQRAVLVTADLCYITGIVKDHVVKRLQQLFGTLYRHDNILITATHTHSGPAGYSQHAMYNMPSHGFSKQNFNIIVSGIVQSIIQAHQSLQPGHIEWFRSSLKHASRNRSLDAFEQNPDELKALLPRAVDESVTMIKLQTNQGPLGIMHWFAVHGTSLDKTNHLISGDNKGYAAWKFEKLMHENLHKDFVAAFANSNAGDSSPNIAGDIDGDGNWECNAHDHFSCMQDIGEKQFNSALQLFQQQGPVLKNRIKTILKFVDMTQITLSPDDTGLKDTVATCDPAIGISMLAGSEEDGPGVGQEGVSCQTTHNPLVQKRCRKPEFSCHGVKPVVIMTRQDDRISFLARTVPVQLIIIGELALAGVPAEMTSMAGYLLRDSLVKSLAPQGVKHVIIAAYANEYTNYITTPEEYQKQDYEGASTLFGPWTLLAYQKVFRNLAEDITINSGQTLGTAPSYAIDSLNTAKQQQGIDRHPWHHSFGEVTKDVHDVYHPGDTVTVSFQASNLNNNMHLNGSFFYIERKVNHEWQPYLSDHDFYTRLYWIQKQRAQSIVDIQWNIHPSTPTGTYRIRFSGTALRHRGKLKSYQGLSSIFYVEAEHD